jgi:hypothetical protein
MARETQEQQHLSAPLTGDDAERFVAYIDEPVAPAGHNEYLREADDTHAQIQPRSDTGS